MRTAGRKLRKRKTYDQKLHENPGLFCPRPRLLGRGRPRSGILRMEAMRGLFAARSTAVPQGASTLFVHANDAKQIAEVIRFQARRETSTVWCSSADWTAG